ncbi:hypothetical protein [Brevundimonas sp. DS20]|uniref:hypothetical protein n=1 Tax=Brevundimonas sp. DS20 TaxID=1532555 RepID=UPI0006CFFF2D|nr:hypothetical protein [Brevundimonas sp. DS20]ALJ08237.1 hypothetical protein JL11_07695 [Brevundimonas sp. DS20]
MRVRFTDDFPYTPADNHRVLIEYRKGHELTVKREAGEAAVAAGKAVEVKAPARKSDDAEA